MYLKVGAEVVVYFVLSWCLVSSVRATTTR